jgi:CheY-like chemotaxis protein
MQVSCQKCQAQFELATEGLPQGKEVWLVCPTCHAPFPWKGIQEGAQAGQEEQASASKQSTRALAEGVFLPMDVVTQGKETALICATDPKHLQVFEQILKGMDYYVATAHSAKDALIKLRSNDYNAFIMDDTFQGEKAEKEILVQFIQQMPIHARRNCFVCILSEELRSMDNMAAFAHCANLVVNVRDLERAEIILKRAISEFKGFYRVFWAEIQGMEKFQS